MGRIIRHHHERFDGKGYPDNLRHDEIPLESAIIAIADAFDAMTTFRPINPLYQFSRPGMKSRETVAPNFIRIFVISSLASMASIIFNWNHWPWSETWHRFMATIRLILKPRPHKQDKKTRDEQQHGSFEAGGKFLKILPSAQLCSSRKVITTKALQCPAIVTSPGRFKRNSKGITPRKAKLKMK